MVFFFFERYQKICEDHYEQAKVRLRDELIQNFNDERRKLISTYEDQLDQVRKELDTRCKEMTDVKSMYVNVCEEKNKVADEVRKTCEELKKNEIKQVKLLSWCIRVRENLESQGIGNWSGKVREFGFEVRENFCQRLSKIF